MRKAIKWSMVLMMLIGTGVYGAERYYFGETESSWFATNNWSSTSGTPTPVGQLPTSGDQARILGDWAQVGVTVDGPGAVIGDMLVGLWGSGGSLTIEAAGELTSSLRFNLFSPDPAKPAIITNHGQFTTATGASFAPAVGGGEAAFINHGTFSSPGVFYVTKGTCSISNTASFACGGLNPGGADLESFTVYNTGTMNITAGWLYLATATGSNCTWNMLGGEINVANKLSMGAGGSAHLNLHGGTITAGNIGMVSDGNYTIDISGDGKLIVNGDHTGGLNYMINLGQITASDGGTPVSEYADGKTTLWSTKIATPYPALAALVYGPELIANSDFSQVSDQVGVPHTSQYYNITNSFGDFGPFNDATARATGWEYYYDDPNGLSTNLGSIRHRDEGGVDILDGTFYIDAFVNPDLEHLNFNSVMDFRHGVKQVDVLNGVTIDAGAVYAFAVNAAAVAGYDPESGTLTATLTDGSGTPIVGGTLTGTLDTWNGLAGLTLSGDMLNDGQVDVMVDVVGTNDIPGYPTASTSNNVGSIVAKVLVHEVTLAEVSVPQANDLNRDGVVNILDADLSQSYLDGSIDGGDDAVTRQNMNIADGMTTNEALTALNLTEFDYNGDGFFDAADVAALEANFPLLIENGVMDGSGHFEVDVINLRPGTAYKLMKATDLVNGSFDVEVDSVTTDAGSATMTDTNAAAGQAFYKVTD